MKHPKRIIPRPSLLLSLICCFLCLVAAVAFAVVLPHGATVYLSEHEPALMQHITLIVACLYVALAVAVAVILLLLCLLNVVRKHAVFSPVSGRLVSVIAALVILEGGVFGVLATVYLPAIAVTFVAVTMGLCFLVVSGVLKEATAIKTENDQTI